VRIPYVLRWMITPPRLLHTCQECICRFSTVEPGSVGPDEQPFPRLCRCPDAPKVHVNCGTSGPYCPACAERIRAEQTRLDEWEKRWD
jgi:hypothetical protein